MPGLGESDRKGLAGAERRYPGLFEQLMGFYPYSVRYEGPDPAGQEMRLEPLSLRLASEFLRSIPGCPRVPGITSLEAALIASGYEVRRETPSFRRLVRTTSGAVRGQKTWSDLGIDRARREFTGKGVRVAVVDTGLDPTLRDVHHQVSAFRDFLAGETPFGVARSFPYDWGGHGTAVASIVSWVARDARLLIARAYDQESMGRAPDNWWTLSVLSAGIAWAAEQGADVINMSFALRTDAGRLKALIRHCWEKNIILVASMGNIMGPEDEPPARYPAAYPWTIAVGGVERTGNGWKVWEHSGRGDYLDVVAPGASLWVEQPNYLDRLASARPSYGNSLATAVVSGTVALVLEAMDPRERAALRLHPGALCDRVREIITGTASNVPLGLPEFNERSGHGLLDPQKAIDAARPRAKG